MIENIASNSVREGRAWSRLPMMTDPWKHLIRGSADFFGLNYYTSRMVQLADSKSEASTTPSWTDDAKLNMSVNASWIQSKSSWLYSVPQGLGDILRL